MNTLEVDSMLSSDCKLSLIFEGVFSSDMLPRQCESNTAVVINLDPHTMPGSHWVCVYICNGIAEYFDSYGQSPKNPHILKFLRNNSKEWTFNNLEMQSLVSNVCGHYCIYFLSERARGKSMSEFQNEFKNSVDANDRHVKKSVENRFVNIVKSIAPQSKYCQSCCSRCRV